jgi:hypothetical protein
MGLLATSYGCSNDGDVNIGQTQELGAQLSDYAAAWDGYTEAYTFPPSSSDRVRLLLDAQGNGTIQVGDDALLAAPTDPNVGYPSGSTNPKPDTFMNAQLYGGVLYPVYAAQVTADRIQVGLKPNDYYGSWCALQTPVPFAFTVDSTPGGGSQETGVALGTPGAMVTYSCVQSGYGGGITFNGSVPTCQLNDYNQVSIDVDCGKFAICVTENACACTATSCISAPNLPAATSPSGYPAELDGALDSSGKSLTGTLNLNGTRITVHLTRK